MRRTWVLAAALLLGVTACSDDAAPPTPAASQGTHGVNFWVSVSGNAGGVVRSSSGTVDCGTACGAFFPWASTVTLTATPDDTHAFRAWAGACTPDRVDGAVCTLPSAAALGSAVDRVVVAIFDPLPPPPVGTAPVAVVATAGSVTESPVAVTVAAVDPDAADAVTCAIELRSQPAFGAVTLSGGEAGDCRAAARTASFRPLLDGVYSLRVTVSDGVAAPVVRDVTVEVASRYSGGAVTGTTATPSAAMTRLTADLALVPSTSGVTAVQAYRAFANISPLAPPTNGSASTQGPPLAWEARPYDVIDVRDAANYAAGHIPGAVSAPMQELPRLLLAMPWFPSASAAAARKVLVVGYSRGDSSLASLLVSAARFSQGTIPATAAVSYLTDGMATWTVDKGAAPYRWDDGLGTSRFEWTLADTSYVESSPAGTVFTKADKPTYPLPDIADFGDAVAVGDASNTAAMKRILVRAREWTAWAAADADARGLPRSEAFVATWGFYKRLRDAGEPHQVVTNQSDAQWAAERAIGAYRGSGTGNIINPLLPADLALLDPQNPVLYHCFSNGSAVAPCFRMAVLGYKSRTILYGITGAVKRDATGIAAGHNTFYTGLTDASDNGGNDFPLSTSLADPPDLAWAQPAAAGCKACHTDYGTLYALAARQPSAPVLDVQSEGEG